MQGHSSAGGALEATDVSFAEEQLWLADQVGAAAVPFFDCLPSLSLAVRLENALQREALQASLDEIVRRHDVLGSRFVAGDGRPKRLHRSSPVGVTTIDLRRVAGRERSDRARHLLARHTTRRFNLARGPLLRALLVALADDEHILAVTVHHIVFDRWSKRVLATELTHLYEAHATRRAPGLQPLTVRYRDYVEWQRQRVEGEWGRELTDYWTTRLSGLSDLMLPCDGDRRQVASTRAGMQSFIIPSEDAGRLGVMSRRGRVTLATLMLAILKLLLHRVSGLDDIAVGVPLSDRRRPEFEHLIGLFANVVVVRTTITDQMTFLDLLDRVRRGLVEACRYQDLPYGYLLQAIGARTPLYRVVFNFVPNIPASHLELSGLLVTPLEIVPERQSLADVSLHVRQTADGLACRLVYKAELFGQARMQDLAAQFQGLVRAVLDEPQKRVGTGDRNLTLR